MIRAAKNGCSSEITFKGRKVYHDWENGHTHKSQLGMKLCTIKWIENNVTDKSKLNEVMNLFSDWQLYENGWYVPYNDGYKNEHLFYYLTQMHGYSGVRPKELEYFN